MWKSAKTSALAIDNGKNKSKSYNNLQGIVVFTERNKFTNPCKNVVFL